MAEGCSERTAVMNSFPSDSFKKTVDWHSRASNVPCSRMYPHVPSNSLFYALVEQNTLVTIAMMKSMKCRNPLFPVAL